MNRFAKKAALLAAISAMSAQSAQACWNDAEMDAVTISHFNMMLVTGALRCRNTGQDFMEEYGRFVANNNALLGAQSKLVTSHLARTSNMKAADRELDRMMTEFANYYGGGHPNMDCADMQQLAYFVAKPGKSLSELVAVAQETVADLPPPGDICVARIASRD